MSSTRCVPGRSPIGLSDPLRPPLPERFRSVHTVYPEAHTLARPGTGSLSRMWMFICMQAFVHIHIDIGTCCEEPVVRLSGEPI